MIEVAKIFQSGMLLQREMPVSVWGKGTPGEKIRVTLQGKKAETAVKEDGNWSLKLPPLKESFQECMVVESDSRQIVLEEVAVGEVFVAAGQSNMEFWMRYEKHYQEMLPSCENPNIRFYDMPKLAYEGQEKDFDYQNVGKWRKASEKDLEYFSAVGYYLARKLEKDLSVPMGIIGCNWGGTRSAAWMEESRARSIQKEQTADFETKLNYRSNEEFCQMAAQDPMNDTGNSTWNAFNDFILPHTPSEEEIREFFQNQEGPAPDMDQANPKDAPGALFRYMVQKLAPYAVRAVLWYQGESDDAINGTQKNYKDALDAIKEDWRRVFENPSLPFFIVQLPGFVSWLGCVNQRFAVIRECQQKSTDEDANAYLCSISDAGEEFDIHPKNKQVVGERLALLAEKYLFERPILADAPKLKEAKRDGKRIMLSFENAGNGLVLKGNKVNALRVMDGETEIDYTAEIQKEQMILHLSEELSGKLTLKYARDAWYQVNLYNEAGIPAIPFEISMA